MAKLTDINLSIHQQKLKDQAADPSFFKHPIRAKKSPASAAKLTRKYHSRSNGWRHSTRLPQTVWHLVATDAINSITRARREIARINEVERSHLDGTLKHPRLLQTMRKHGSFAQWRSSIIETAKMTLRIAKGDALRSHGFLPG